MAQPTYMTPDFCLETKTAVRLYHEYAEPMPILDYHCHLPPAQIAADQQFRNLFHVWLAGDHYKWRAMRANGVPERMITGDAEEREKFQQWALTVPSCLRNPLYHWTHLEMKKPFGITDRLLDGETAQGIWDECNAKLATPAFSVSGIMDQWNVVLVSTTDDPADSLEYHDTIAANPARRTQVIPSFRPDKGLAVENPAFFNAWIDRLAAAARMEITSWEEYMAALRRRVDFFHDRGCRLSDHGIEAPYGEHCAPTEALRIFAKIRSGKTPDHPEILKFKSAVLYELGCLYHEKGWTQQFHFGALRNVNSRMMKALGPDTGFDTIGDFETARPLAKMLDRLESQDRLPKTILYNLNPRDTELLATMAGCFQGGVPGKLQYGSSWWFLDQKDGMEKQIEAVSNMGLLSRFVGMLTDSRSFLSYSRHEYFRRILCNILGREIEKGLLPNDVELAGTMVKDISYRNAARYFGFTVPER